MESGLQIAIISAGSAILGTLSGSVTSFLGTKRLTREQWRLAQIDKEITAREKLYGDFLGEASLHVISSIDKKTDRVADFVPMFTLLARIRLVATAQVVEVATKTAKVALEAHSAKPERTGEPFGETFSQVCRIELDALRVKALRKAD